MNERTACEVCGEPMSADSARCPHCGARQARAPELAAPKGKPRLTNVSADEAKAILAVSAAQRGGTFELSGGEQNIIEWLFFPDPRSSPNEKILEIILGALGLPVLLAGSGCLLFMWRRVASARRQGSVAAGRLLAAVGSITLATSVYSWSIPLIVAVCVVPIVAVWSRELVRIRAHRRHRTPDMLG